MDGLNEKRGNTMHKKRQATLGVMSDHCKRVQAWNVWDEVDFAMIVSFFAGCGLVASRSRQNLHSGLLQLIEGKEVSVINETQWYH